MKSFMFVAILFTFLFSSVYGAISAGFFNDPRNPGKCSIRDNLVLAPGDMIKDPNHDCGRILCGGRGYAEFHTCGVEFIEGCTMGDYVDTSLPYPACCKRHVICN